MNAPIRAAELCIRTWPPEDRLVAIVSGYFDDSQSPGDIWTVAGYVGYVNQWDYFEQLWTEALGRHEVPYFHMKEMASPSGPFAKWLPPQDHVDEVAAFFKDLVAAINRSGLYMVCSSVWLKDLERFNQETGIGLEPYPLAAHACLAMIAEKYDRIPITAVFDRIEKVESKLATARAYLASETFVYPELCDHIASTWLPAPTTAQNVPALQAADLIAWEVRKAHFGMKEWQLSERPIDSDRWSQWWDYVEYTKQITGENPKIRKSLDALITSGSLKSIVWDYLQLQDTNKARRGVWKGAAQ
jgi:hypothetical protein